MRQGASYVKSYTEGRGLLAEFDSPESIARCVNLYLDDPVFRHKTEERAVAYGRAMTWARVGTRYAALFRAVAQGDPPAGASTVPA